MKTEKVVEKKQIKIIDFRFKNTDMEGVIILQPGVRVRGYDDIVVSFNNNGLFNVKVGCQDYAGITPSTVAEMINELSGNISKTPVMLKCIIGIGGSLPARVAIESGKVSILAEESESYFIDQDARVWPKAQYLIIECEGSPSGKWVKKINAKSGNTVWHSGHELKKLDVEKLLHVLKVMDEYYKENPVEERKK